jgi:D-arginine dehydrogenase
MKDEFSVAIIGAGIAGTASAYFLAQKGMRNIVLLEQERTAGEHSTGRNAAIMRTFISDPVLRALARASAEFYWHPPQDFSPEPLIDKVGIYLAAGKDSAQELKLGHA